MKLKWKKIKGFNNYLISNDGVVLNIKTGRLSIGHHVKLNGGLAFELSDNGNRQYRIMVHKLVAKYFKRSELNKEYIAHIDYDKLNNKVTNLKWSTFGDLISRTRRRNEIKKNKVRGVYKYTSGNQKYRAVLSIGKEKTKTLGYFPTKKQAVVCYYNAYVSYYGEEPFK